MADSPAATANDANSDLHQKGGEPELEKIVASVEKPAGSEMSPSRLFGRSFTNAPDRMEERLNQAIRDRSMHAMGVTLATVKLILDILPSETRFPHDVVQSDTELHSLFANAYQPMFESIREPFGEAIAHLRQNLGSLAGITVQLVSRWLSVAGLMASLLPQSLRNELAFLGEYLAYCVESETAVNLPYLFPADFDTDATGAIVTIRRPWSVLLLRSLARTAAGVVVALLPFVRGRRTLRRGGASQASTAFAVSGLMAPGSSSDRNSVTTPRRTNSLHRTGSQRAAAAPELPLQPVSMAPPHLAASAAARARLASAASTDQLPRTDSTARAAWMSVPSSGPSTSDLQPLAPPAHIASPVSTAFPSPTALAATGSSVTGPPTVLDRSFSAPASPPLPSQAPTLPPAPAAAPRLSSTPLSRLSATARVDDGAGVPVDPGVAAEIEWDAFRLREAGIPEDILRLEFEAIRAGMASETASEIDLW
ncbi:hypothetical protein HK405_011575 [Cladochytrium tenue]|nr:hypothetical protein HK405_011575 [Cladochytrium tenue]